MIITPPKSPNSPDKGTPLDKGAGELGDLLPLSFPSTPLSRGARNRPPCHPPLSGGVQRGSGGLWKLREDRFRRSRESSTSREMQAPTVTGRDSEIPPTGGLNVPNRVGHPLDRFCLASRRIPELIT